MSEVRQKYPSLIVGSDFCEATGKIIPDDYYPFHPGEITLLKKKSTGELIAAYSFPPDQQKKFISILDFYSSNPDHPTIVHLHGVIIDQQIALFEHLPNCSLRQILRRKDLKVWDDTLKLKTVFAIASAMTHLHNLDREYSHNFLTPDNIFFDAKWNPKVINPFLDPETDFKVPAAYIPPEIYNAESGEQVSRTDVDIWCFGMILYEILTGEVPFKDCNDSQIRQKIKNKEIPTLPKPNTNNEYALGVIQNCLEYEPYKRPLFYHLYDFLFNSSNNKLFPNADMNEVQDYIIITNDSTYQNDESSEYLKHLHGETGIPFFDIDELERKAESGDALSLLKLGRIFQKGLGGIQKDEKAAFDYFKIASDDGNAIASYNLALCYIDGRGITQDKFEGYKLIQKSFQQGCKKALLVLGNMNLSGDGTNKDEAKARDFFEKGSEEGIGECSHHLGVMAENNGDINTALKYYEKAGRDNYAKGYLAVGNIYYNRKDEAKAIIYYEKAAKNNQPIACSSLGHIYMKKRDNNNAAKWFKKGKDLNDKDSMFRYALLLRDEKADIKDPSQSKRQARKYFKILADEGNPMAQLFFAQMMRDGLGGSKNPKGAYDYFKKAAEADCLPAIGNLAKLIYSRPEGVPYEIETINRYCFKFEEIYHSDPKYENNPKFKELYNELLEINKEIAPAPP